MVGGGSFPRRCDRADAGASRRVASRPNQCDRVTLRSVAVDLPDRGVTFPGPGSDAVNNNCLTCHSAGMVLNQPEMSRTVWQGEVEKMIGTYKAPIAQGDVGAIVDYLANLKGVN
jgi:hypothetical protein